MPDERRVYVVDDDAAVLNSVRAVLEPQGYQVECFFAAEQLLAQAAIHMPGCVITDLQMPGMDGAELQQRLLESGSPLSVIVVTGVATVPLTVQIIQRGAITLLEKPYQQLELRRTVETALAASRERWRRVQDEQFLSRRLESLTEDEHQVMRLMIQGKLNKAIAAELAMSLRTLDRRRRAVLDKMGVETVPELVSLLRARSAAALSSDLRGPVAQS